MSTAIRSYFSGRRIRYVDGEFNLDLTYITDRIMAMGYPSVKFESFYRNNIADVSKMLNQKHGKHYLILNLSDRDYDYTPFGNRVIVCGFADHHAPPLGLMWAIYSFVDLWIAVDPKNVVAAHCLAGKGRTGIVICCTLLMQGFFNKLNANTTTEYVNAAVNYFHQKRGDGVENPDQVKFIRDFLVSTDTVGTNNKLQFDTQFQPSLYLGSLVLYNVPIGVGDAVNLSLVVYLKYRNEWNVVYNSAWSYYPLPQYEQYQKEIVIDINVPARGDLLFMVKNEKKEILHFSINTTQIPCCTPEDLNSIYFYKNNISISKTSKLPLTQSFAVQLICLDQSSFNNHSQSERLNVIHAITRQAIAEERERRKTLIHLHDNDEKQIISSEQYRDLLNMNLDMFSSPRPSGEMFHSPNLGPSSSFDFDPLNLGGNQLQRKPHSNPSSPLRPSSFSDLQEGIMVSKNHSSELISEPTVEEDISVRPRSFANPKSDRFSQRIPFFKQISLSYGGEYCQNSNTLSVNLPPPKVKGKRRDLTSDEKELFSREDLAFTLYGMEDMEMRIMASACDAYMQEKAQQPEDGSSRITPLQSIMNECVETKDPKDPKEPKEYFSQIIVAKFFANIYEKRVWKRRLVIITQTMVLVMKRPSDHYLKNAVVLNEMKQAIAMPFTEENKSWIAGFHGKKLETQSLTLQFDTFNDLMLFIAITRRLAGYPVFSLTIPDDCRDRGLYKDIASLLYLFNPTCMNERTTIYNECMVNPSFYEQWVSQQFHLPPFVCRNIQIVDTLEEIEDIITEQFMIVPSELYLKPKYTDIREIPEKVKDIVHEFQMRIKDDIYIRLVQVCQFSYPSPQPLVRAILDLYEESWAIEFDNNPFAFLKAIRESSYYREESFTNRSYRKSHELMKS